MDNQRREIMRNGFKLLLGFSKIPSYEQFLSKNEKSIQNYEDFTDLRTEKQQYYRFWSVKCEK